MRKTGTSETAGYHTCVIGRGQTIGMDPDLAALCACADITGCQPRILECAVDRPDGNQDVPDRFRHDGDRDLCDVAHH